jgi:hypothetical protein
MLTLMTVPSPKLSLYVFAAAAAVAAAACQKSFSGCLEYVVAFDYPAGAATMLWRQL